MDKLAAMHAFRRVVERASFSKAAEELGMSPAAVGKQVRWLEQSMHAALLLRTTRTMSLTDTGRAYYQECCRLLDELDELERSTSGEQAAMQGRVRINAPMSLSLSVLSPLLARFMDQYPEIDVELTMADRLLDVIAEGFDLSLRVRTTLPDSTLVVRAAGKVEQWLCAAPAYLRQHGTPRKPSDLLAHRALAFRLAETPGLRRLKGVDGVCEIEPPVRMWLDNSLMLGQMLAAGQGIGSLPSFIARPLLAQGALERVLPAWQLQPRVAYIVYPGNRHLQTKVRALSDFLAAELPALF
jgi:DNA-binding transcriptional LysR family regulator